MGLLSEVEIRLAGFFAGVLLGLPVVTLVAAFWCLLREAED